MVSEYFDLKKYNTFGLESIARYFVRVRSEEEAREFSVNRKMSGGPVLILGGGSNMLFTGDFPGTVIHIETAGIKVEELSAGYVIVSAGAGMAWDDFVSWCVGEGYGGIENLSLIPGTVGAAPVQNIGAYGAEAKDIIVKVRAVSLKDGSVCELSNSECRFGYRNSIFKAQCKGELLVTKVFFRLDTAPVLNLSYGTLAREALSSGTATLRSVREAVIKIRRSKLPDPGELGNAGSFFKNPVVSPEKASALSSEFPGIPCYDDPSGGIKIAAGWLIEQCGLKGKRSGAAGIYPQQALVIVNYGGATGKEIFELSELVRQSVYDKFGVSLEREVELAGSI
jgi:UDP-N-acetylmuramate dehydrogenase